MDDQPFTISELRKRIECVGGLPALWSPLPTWWAAETQWASGDGRSTGVIAHWRVGNSRVARAAEWSRVPWRGGRGSGGEDEQSSIIRFNYNLLYAYPNHSNAPFFYTTNSNYSFSWNFCSRGTNSLMPRAMLCAFVITGITVRWPRALPAKIVNPTEVSV